MTVEHVAEPASRVLIVDDNEQNRELARATLEDDGYLVFTANDGEEAVRAFELHDPDCVLMDVRMPKLDGLQACRRIRQLPQGSDRPIVFLTALRDLDTFDAALRAGGDDFLTKPIRPTELLLRLQAALKLRRLSQSNREHLQLITRQRDDLMRLQLQQERLIAFVVHDLKNPVNAMDLQAQLLLRQKDLPERVYRSAAGIRNEVQSLMRLILNLLDITKSEEGQLTPNPEIIELQPLFGQVARSLTPQAEAREVAIRTQAQCDTLRADPDLLRRVLENLLDNAIRHAPVNTSVWLRAESKSQRVLLQVADAGTGIPAELHQNVFDRYVRVKNPEASVDSRSGRGLGLQFCKLAIEAHGGKIWIEDAAPGAVFCIEVPA